MSRLPLWHTGGLPQSGSAWSKGLGFAGSFQTLPRQCSSEQTGALLGLPLQILSLWRLLLMPGQPHNVLRAVHKLT